MTVFLIKRILQSIFVLLVTSLVVYAGIYLIGSPVDFLIKPDATFEEKQVTIHALGLDLPIHEQYFVFLKNAIKGNLGNSFIYNRPAIKLIFERLPATLELTIFAMIFAVFFGIPIGLIAGFKPESFRGRSIMWGSILCFSLPTFWVGLQMIAIFSIHFGWLPSFGRVATNDIFGVSVSFLTWDGLSRLIMPSINLGLYPFALIVRLTYSGVKETMPLDFIKFAMAKGLKTRRIVLLHVLKNIIIPIVTIIGLSFAALLAFSVITENIFAWPGMGKLLVDSIVFLDRPVIVAYLLVVVLVFSFTNLTIDVIYFMIDPRIRLPGR